MKVRLIQSVDGKYETSEFEVENIVSEMERRGFKFTKLSDNSPHKMAELQNQPQFAGLIGPMWDSEGLRYEDIKTNDILST